MPPYYSMFLPHFVIVIQKRDVDSAPTGAKLTLMKELEKQEEISRKRREISKLEKQLADIRTRMKN